MKNKVFEEWATENSVKLTNTREMAQAMKEYLEWLFQNSHLIEGGITTTIARDFQDAVMFGDLDWSVERIEMSWYKSRVIVLEEEGLKPKPAQKRPLTRKSCPAEDELVLIWTDKDQILTGVAKYTEIFGEERVLTSFRSAAEEFNISWRNVTGWCPIERS